MERLTLTPREVGEALGLSERSVLNLLDAKALPEMPRWTRKRLIPKAAVDALMAKVMDGFDADEAIAAIGGLAGTDTAA